MKLSEAVATIDRVLGEWAPSKFEHAYKMAAFLRRRADEIERRADAWERVTPRARRARRKGA